MSRKVSHVRWACSHQIKCGGKSPRYPTRSCGRDAAAIWCRIAGKGGAYLARCAAHDKKMHEHPEWERVAAEDFDDRLKARRVSAVLVARAQPEEAEQAFRDEQARKYLLTKTGSSFGGGYPKARSG